LKKRIEDAVVRVETTASSALELEEARRIKQEEVLRNRNLWDNPAKSHETLSALADAIRVVDHLKDLRFKVQQYEFNKQFFVLRISRNKHAFYCVMLHACEQASEDKLNHVYSVTSLH
jgi:anion-transporting  ArsA/GET3 family ATPase